MNWHFGMGAGLDFSSGSTVSTGDSTMVAREASCTYSDENENLLFYSSGVRVLSDTCACRNEILRVITLPGIIPLHEHQSVIKNES